MTTTAVSSLPDLMLAKGLGPSEVCARASIGRSSLWRWVTRRSVPRAAQARRLAVVLGVSPKALVAAIRATEPS